MQLEHAFNSVKRACYAGLDSVTLRREIVSRISGAVPFDAYAFSVCDPDTGLMAHTVAEGIPVALARMYVEVLYPSVAGTPAEISSNGSSVFSMADETPLIQRAFRAYGVQDETHVSISTPGRLWGTWCLMRFGSSTVASRRHFPFLERLTPHIARGLQSSALIDYALTGGADDSSTQAAPGVLVLDSANRATLRTERATTWLADLRDVGLSVPDDIPLSVISLASRLRASGKAGRSEAHVRVRGLSGRWYVLRASLSLPGASGKSSLVVVIRPAMALEVATILTRLYGFSVREREVIAALVRGEATKTIAASLGLSPYTVTEHIDRACCKLGVRGRKALIAKLFFQGYAPNLRSVKPTIGANAKSGIGPSSEAHTASS